jgi:hypothetical protein
MIGKIRDPAVPPGSARPLRRFLTINLLWHAWSCSKKPG